MNNKLFNTKKTAAPSNAINDAGGVSYKTSDEHALAQFACTGTFGGTYYASDADELSRVIPLAEKVSPEFLAKCAVYGRTKGLLRDMPTYLLAVLSRRDNKLFAKSWDRIVQGPGELRSFVQFCRSGKAGRKNIGCNNPKTEGGSPRAQIHRWFRDRNADAIYRASVGSNPTLGEVVALAHPKPDTPEKAALFNYLKGREFDASAMPQTFKDMKAYENNPSLPQPSVPIELLNQKTMGAPGWSQYMRRASWRATLRNLAKASDAGAFNDKAVLDVVCDRIRDNNLREKSGVFTYQLQNAFLQAESAIPSQIKQAIHDAMEMSASGLPKFTGKVTVCLDVSGSMGHPVTNRGGHNTTSVRCVDVASLIASVMMRNALDAAVIPFSNVLKESKIRAQDSIITNTEKLASLLGGGTTCHLPLCLMNEKNIPSDLVLMVSDNESWGQYTSGSRYAGYGWSGSSLVLQAQSTGLAQEWQTFKKKNPKAKLCLIDLTPTSNSQILSDKDVLLIGGFSDHVWNILGNFVDENQSSNRWVDEINKVEI